MRAASPVDPDTRDAPPRGAARGNGRRVRDLPLRVMGLVAGLVFAAPLIFLLQQAVSFGAPFRQALVDPVNLPPLGRSLLLAGTVAAATSVLGTACAWVVTRTDLPAARTWAVVLALPLVLPSYIGAFTLQAALSRGGLTDRVVGLSLPSVEGFWAAFAIMTLLTYPYVFLLVAARLRQLPVALEESARLLGHRPLAIVRTVVLPQVAPAVAAGGLLVFLYVVSDFGAVQLLRYDTLTRVIFGNLLDRPLSSALALQLGVVALLIAGGERAALARARRTGAATMVRGASGLRYPLGRWRMAALAWVGGVAVAALVGPMTVLVYWATRGVLAGSDRASSALADPALLLTPLVGSASAGLLAAGVATVVSLPVAVLTVRHRGRIADGANALVIAGFAMPGLIIALSLAFFTLRGPAAVATLYQTMPLLIMAYVVHFGAQSLRAAQVGVAAVPTSVIDAARTLGVRPWRRLLRVELPLMAPSLLAGAGLVLLSTLKELPATLLLAPSGFRSLATDVWGATTDAFWAEASLLALLLVALSGALTWLLVLRRADALS